MSFEHNSNKTYNADFSKYYDIITAHKNYSAEVEALHAFIQRQSVRDNLNLLDLGCGTGTHAIKLSIYGYNITGLDLSPDMIKVAQSKQSNVKFINGNIDEFDEMKFDGCYSLFNVINCLPSLEDLAVFIEAVYRVLKEGAFFLFECWNPIAILQKHPEVVVREYEYEQDWIKRVVTPEWDFLYQKLKLIYDIEIYNIHKDAVERSFTAMHDLLLFSPLEIEYFLKNVGFKKIELYTALPDLENAMDTSRIICFTCQK